MIPEADAADVCRSLADQGIRFWVVGGWGVDALLGRVTRPHNDLDILLTRSQHGLAWRLLHERGLRLAYRWEENVDLAGAFPDDDAQPTAYVLEGPAGVLVDVHVFEDARRRLTPLWRTDRLLIAGALDATGVIDGVPVRCMSARMQLLAHEGYELPPTHQADVALLEGLADRRGGVR